MIVVDATAFAAFLLREPQGDAVLEQMLAHDAMLAPGLLAYELANVIAQAQRSGRLDDAAAERAREQCAGFPWVFEQHASRDRAASLSALSARHGVSAYRVAYLDIARHHNCPLLTLDDALRAAAAREGVQVLPAPAGKRASRR